MFLYTHIEKCAGTSFNELLSLSFLRYIHITKNRFGGNELKNDLSLEQYIKISKYYPTGIGGHSVRPYLEYFDDKTLKITFLRNPIDRYISHMNHIIETKWASSVDDFIAKEQYWDFMTKKIAGSNDFNKASNLLSGFHFIGDVNQYAKSLNYLEDVFDRKLISKNENRNQRKTNDGYIKFSDLSNEQKNRVEQNNVNDIKLYDSFIVNSSIISSYDPNFIVRPPSLLREKLVLKLNKIKKKKIVEPIRLY